MVRNTSDIKEKHEANWREIDRMLQKLAEEPGLSEEEEWQ